MGPPELVSSSHKTHGRQKQQERSCFVSVSLSYIKCIKDFNSKKNVGVRCVQAACRLENRSLKCFHQPQRLGLLFYSTLAAPTKRLFPIIYVHVSAHACSYTPMCVRVYVGSSASMCKSFLPVWIHLLQSVVTGKICLNKYTSPETYLAPL